MFFPYRLSCIFPCLSLAQDKPLRITITDGVVEPLPLAIPKFLSEIIAVKEVAKNISSLVSEDLTKTGLFRIIPDDAHISKITNFKALLPYSDWKAINVQGLISGAVTITKLKNHDCEDHRGCLVVKYKLFDIFSENIISAKLDWSRVICRRAERKCAGKVFQMLDHRVPPKSLNRE